MLHRSWMDKTTSFFCAIGWGFVAIFAPDAAGKEMARRLCDDPNQTITSLTDKFCSVANQIIVSEETGIIGIEFTTIAGAAVRNDCLGDDFLILLAIRKAENGRPGLEFGVMHWRCRQIMRDRPDETLDIQAGWAAATIVKNRTRWESRDKGGNFIEYLANIYCPPSVDPAGNEYWKVNVSFWFEKLRGSINGSK